MTPLIETALSPQSLPLLLAFGIILFVSGLQRLAGILASLWKHPQTQERWRAIRQAHTL